MGYRSREDLRSSRKEAMYGVDQRYFDWVPHRGGIVLMIAAVVVMARMGSGNTATVSFRFLLRVYLCVAMIAGLLLLAQGLAELIRAGVAEQRGNEFSYQPNYRKLVADEVYLYAAFTDPTYRGHGLAPLMRAAVYASLREMGYRKFYSYSNFFNTAARRLKAKLGAQEEALRIHLELFEKWSKTLTLRRYS